MSKLMTHPNFGENIDSEPEPCSPHSLYLSLLDAERHVGHYKPAFEFAQSAFSSTRVDASLDNTDISDKDFVDLLTSKAKRELSEALQDAPKDASDSWCIRVVREFAPAGLTDGSWLQGAVKLNVVESETGMLFLKQFMARFGDPEFGPSQKQNYAMLCRSLGFSPDSIQRYEDSKTIPCAEISFEYALLPMTTGLFPNSFRHETAGLNLWMATFGTCPLISHIRPALLNLNASLEYLKDDQPHSLALDVVIALLKEEDGPDIRRRIAQGFLCAHRWYLRWQKAMLGHNIPMSSREFVHELFTQKAPHTLGHHDNTYINGHSLETLFNSESPSDIDKVIDQLEGSRHIVPGRSDKSSLINFSLSIDGPMFGAFSHAETTLLKEWIDSLTPSKTVPEPRPKPEPIKLVGAYGHPQCVDSLTRYSYEYFGGMGNADLYYWFVNADLHPSVRLFAKLFVNKALDQLRDAFQQDTLIAPKYSEKNLTSMVNTYQSDTVRLRRERNQETPKADSFVGKSISGAGIGFVFDGSWVQGMSDPNNADREEYQWLFKIYASELGDGCLSWNHNVIAIQALKEYGYNIEGDRLARVFYDSFSFPIQHMVSIAVSLNTGHFLPEILGINLSIEVQGVGGDFIEKWKDAVKDGHQSMATYSRLHNSIDNFSSGHSKMSQDAVKAFMAKVSACSPSALDETWDRIWTIWRFQEIAEHGSEEEKVILETFMGTNYLSMSAASGVDLVTQQ